MTVRSPVAGAIAGGAAGVAGVLVIALLATTSADTSESADTLQLIKDCTIEPAGKCADLQRQQFASFTHMIALGNACADKPGTQTTAQVERCIKRGMKR